jgi:hypothetical protein
MKTVFSNILSKNGKILLLAATLYCTGLGAQQVQKREIASFSRIEASGSVEIHYTNSDSLSLKVEAAGNELENVHTTVENGTLRIYNKGNFNFPVEVHVKNSQLNSVELSGASSLKTSNAIKNETMELKLSGSSTANIKLEGGDVKCLLSGASNLALHGHANAIKADVAGASALKGFDFQVARAEILTTGAATAKVNVTESLKANASGASDVKVKGQPKELTAESSGAASITRVEPKKNGEKDKDTMTYNLKRKKILVITDDMVEIKNRESRKSGFKHWRGIMAGVNGYVNPAGALSLPKQNSFMELNYARSYNFQFNFIERQFNISSNHVKLVTGLGIDYHQYEFLPRTSLRADSSYTIGRVDTSSRMQYRKNRLRVTYLQVPLLLEFNSSNNPSKSFHIAMGVIGQYRIGSKTKQELLEAGDEITRIRKDDFNLSPFAAKAHVNFGYRGWTIYGEYSLTPLFQSGKGPELYPFAVGLRIVPFS